MKKLLPYAIFDMDGTLVDSMPYWQNCGIEYLLSKGITPREDLWEQLALRSTSECALYMQEEYGVTDTAEEITEANNRIMYEHYRLDIPAKPGVPEYLQKLQEAGVKIAVCSATAIPLVEMTLKRLGLREYFSCLTSCDEVGKGKTEPDVFELAISRFGAKPQECVMYEDAHFGVRTAGKLGMKVAAVYDPSCKEPPEVIRSLSDYYIESYVGLDLKPQEDVGKNHGEGAE